MPEIRTDDGPRRLRAVWLGPKGYTLPFEWSYVQWVVVALTASVGAALAGLFGLWFCLQILQLTNWSWTVTMATIFALAWGVPAGVILGVRAMRDVTPDEPITARTVQLARHLRRRHTEPAPVPVHYRMQMPVIRESCACWPKERNER